MVLFDAIEWPAHTADNRPVAPSYWATATQPHLVGDPLAYPMPQVIAARWRSDTEGNVRYFRNNVRDGIRTFEDEAIGAALDAPA
jgi:hypothetical protein